MTFRRAALLVALALSLALLVVVLIWKPVEPPKEGPTTGLNVVVLAVDGLDWFLLGDYVGQGLLPNIARILRSTAKAEVAADRPLVPHSGWTIVGRGAPLTDEEMRALEDQGDARLFGVVPDVARLVNEYGGSSVVVGWPAAWPVGDVSGVAAPYTPESPDHVSSLAPALFAGAPGQAGDADVASVIDKAVQRNLESADTDFAELIHDGGCGDPVAEEALAAVKWGFVADRIALDVGGRLTAEREPDLSLIYLGGLDTAMHRFLAPAKPEFFEGIEPIGKDCADVVPNYYAFIDEAVGRLLRMSEESTVFILVSAYGTHPSVEALPATAGHELGPPGVLLVRGPHLLGAQGELEVTTTDLAPTMLEALGLPIPDDLPGRIIQEALPKGTLELFPPSFVPRSEPYLTSEEAPPECAEMESMVRERLSELR